MTLAFNGEIYNYGALATDLLHRRGIRVKSEAEPLLALYLSEGVDFVHSIDGDYAIVVCDDRSRECHLFRESRAPIHLAIVADPLAGAPRIAQLSAGLFDFLRSLRTWRVLPEVTDQDTKQLLDQLQQRGLLEMAIAEE